MFRSLMTIIRELYLYLTNVIYMLKYSVKLRRFIYIYCRHFRPPLCLLHAPTRRLNNEITVERHERVNTKLIQPSS